MSLTCITCGGSMPDDADFCPSCGRAVLRALVEDPPLEPGPAPMRDPEPERIAEPNPDPQRHGPSGAVARPVVRVRPSAPEPVEDAPRGPVAPTNDRILAAIAYLTFLPALGFLFLKQFQARDFVRFHALQSLFFWLLVIVLAGVGALASTFGLLLLWLVTGILVVLALALTWLVLSIKALQGEWFRLPLFSEVAGQFGW